MVAHDGHGLVEKTGDFVVGEIGEEGFEELGVVAAAGGDELLLNGGALLFRMLAAAVWLGDKRVKGEVTSCSSSPMIAACEGCRGEVWEGK